VVVSNQLSLYVVLAFAFGTGGKGPVSAYTYGWSFMQMPYAVVVVSVLSVLTPQLAALATAQDFTALTQRLSMGLRQSLVIILPCTVILVVLAQPIVGILLNHNDATGSLMVGRVLAILAIGLPGFTVFQLGVRGLQSLQRAREVFALYALENLLTIAFCLLIGRHSIAGLTGAISLAYSISALVAMALLAHHQVVIFPTLWSKYIRRSLTASLAMGIVMAAAYATVNWNEGVLLILRTLVAGVAGLGAYAMVAFLGPRNARPSANLRG
jgi:putative peptidoglycan lipid II flippase